jgi:hypothetical protein
MTTTAGDQINGALRLIGQLAEGETPSAATSADALTAMNQMLDSWSSERLSVFSTQDQVFTWPASTATRTLGPTGNFVGNRPVLVDDSTYFVDTGNGISFGIKLINQQQYNGIAVKTVTSTYPQVMFVNMKMSDIEMTVYPVPSTALEWHIISVNELVEPATLATVLVIPPGYLAGVSGSIWRARLRQSLASSRRPRCSELLCRASATLSGSITPTTL